ncbi:MAG TPA: hypothetical protein VJM46_02755 [Candidatus Saccharimonadales bacterium]|nr:hypothetical protein [Candidatus Saccharimonadales bacterium]
MSIGPHHDDHTGLTGSNRRPRRKIRWSRWIIGNLIAAGIMTYIEVALLDVIGEIINAAFDTNAGDQPVLLVVIGIFVFCVDLFITAIASIFLGLFLAGRRASREANRTEP